MNAVVEGVVEGREIAALLEQLSIGWIVSKFGGDRRRLTKLLKFIPAKKRFPFAAVKPAQPCVNRSKSC